MLETQTRPAVRLPLSASVAVPANDTVELDVMFAPATGEAIATTGAASGFTVTITVALPVLPPESVTDATIVWVPGTSDVPKLPPLPMAPLMLDVHFRFAVMVPSSTSMADAVNGIVAL